LKRIERYEYYMSITGSKTVDDVARGVVFRHTLDTPRRVVHRRRASCAAPKSTERSPRYHSRPDKQMDRYLKAAPCVVVITPRNAAR